MDPKEGEEEVKGGEDEGTIEIKASTADDAEKEVVERN